MKSKVAIVRNENIYEATFRALDYLEYDLKGKVLIKPNLTLDVPIQRRACTNPQVIDALIDAIRNFNGEAFVGESSMVGCDTLKAYEKSGLKEVCERKKVKFIDFNRCEPVRVKINGEFLKEIVVAKEIFEFDKIISAPVMKTHVLTGVTLGMKNMKGLQYGNEKIRLHRKGIKMLHIGIVDINIAFKPYLTVIDASYAQDGEGPVAGNVKKMDLVVASRDVVSADATACKIMEINPYSVYHIKRGEEKGLGKIKDVELKGEKIKDVREKFENPVKSNRVKYWVFDFGMVFASKLKGKLGEEGYRVIAELMRTKPFISHDCRKCGRCYEICHQKAIENFKINHDKCVACMICMEACPFNAIKLEKISIIEGVREISKFALKSLRKQ
ncbi:MAG: DUF362 domain-containing protein [Thermoplasmatales archaeon]|nr:DUF362 domain-containing protein [Thermoplasmatales archaeon]